LSGRQELAGLRHDYAEGQRRYVESLSAYARQFLGQMDKPDVDSIEACPRDLDRPRRRRRAPALTVGHGHRDLRYLRLLWSRIGKPHCHICGKPVTGQSAEQIIASDPSLSGERDP